jgi:hypothetical protein
MPSKSFALFSLAVIPAVALAQAPGWNGPSTGLLFDPATKSLRRIDGFLGAAQLSPPVVDTLEWAAVAPNGQRALARTPSGEWAWLDALDRADYSSFPVPLSGIPPFLARWNSDSSSVRLYSSDCSCFQTVALQSQGTPALSGERQFIDPSFGGVLDFFWKDSVTVAATERGLVQIDGTAPPRLLLASEPGLNFWIEPTGKTWAVRSATGEIFEVRLPTDGNIELRLIASDPERFTSLSAISSTSGAIWAADRNTRSVHRISLATGMIEISLDLDSYPTGLTRLGNRPLWLLRHRSRAGEPVFVLDDSSSPQVFFVPGGDQQ